LSLPLQRAGTNFNRAGQDLEHQVAHRFSKIMANDLKSNGWFGFIYQPHSSVYPSWSGKPCWFHVSRERFVPVASATVWWSFTLFEARSINFSIMV